MGLIIGSKEIMQLHAGNLLECTKMLLLYALGNIDLNKQDEFYKIYEMQCKKCFSCPSRNFVTYFLMTLPKYLS